MATRRVSRACPPTAPPARTDTLLPPPTTTVRSPAMLAELIHPIRRFRTLRRNARLYLLSNTLQAATAGAAGVLYTLYLASLGYGTDFIGLVAVVATIGGGLGIIPAGWLVRRVGWRTGLIWSDLIGGVSVALQLVFPTTPVILL